MANLTKPLALLYVLICLSCGAWLAYQLPQIASQVDFDVFSLLPKNQKNLYAEQALTKISTKGQNAVVFLVKGADIHITSSVARQLIKKLETLGLVQNDIYANVDDLKQLYLDHRLGLVTAADLARLALADNENTFWYQRSLALAFSMTGQALTWQEDPFGLFSNWLLELGQITKFRPQEGLFTYTTANDQHYIAIQMLVQHSAFSVTEAQMINAQVEKVIKQLSGQSQVQILRSGVLFHTAYAADQMEHEVTLMSTISMIAIVLLITLVLKSIRGVFLITLSILVGTMFAVVVTYSLFGRIYGLTLVFATSLMGVAVDHGLIYLATLADDREMYMPAEQRRKKLYRAMALALLTNILAYATLLFTPFPVFSQMAVFAIVGITTAALVVFLWFPYLQTTAQPTPRCKYSVVRYTGCAVLARWTMNISRFFKQNKYTLSMLLGLVSLGGLLSLKANDDVRALVNLNPQLINQQIEIAKVFDVPSPAQFFIVVDQTVEGVLRNTEALTQSLDKLIAQHTIAGYEAVTRYLPSIYTQQTALNLSKQCLYANPALLSQIAKVIPITSDEFTTLIEKNQYLTHEVWLNNPLFTPLHFLLFQAHDGKWISVVLLKGLSQANLSQLATMQHSVNTYWIDKPNQISAQMKQNRHLFSYLLVSAYVVALLLAYAKYRKQAWRVVLPPILGSVCALAIFSMLGREVNLLVITALLLILGLGMDYGIFLNNRVIVDVKNRIRIGVTLAMLTTVLSFGLLSLSRVPVISGFALILALGILFTWLLASLLALPDKMSMQEQRDVSEK